MTERLQSVIFDKYFYTEDEAEEWLEERNLMPIKPVHETKNYYRFRINPPDKRKRYRTITESNGIKLVVMI